ncbi:MAG: TonB family protein, partial [Myxococcota bacterium]
REANLEGTVKAAIDIDDTGKVIDVRILSGLTAAADAACVKTLSGCSFRPGKQDDTPVTITNFPRRCRFKAIE